MGWSWEYHRITLTWFTSLIFGSSWSVQCDIQGKHCRFQRHLLPINPESSCLKRHTLDKLGSEWAADWQPLSLACMSAASMGGAKIVCLACCCCAATVSRGFSSLSISGLIPTERTIQPTWHYQPWYRVTIWENIIYSAPVIYMILYRMNSYYL